MAVQYDVLCLQAPHRHDIKLNSFKMSVALKFMILLENLIITNLSIISLGNNDF